MARSKQSKIESKERALAKQKSANPYEDRFGLVYARVSGKRQELEGTGLESQEGRCLKDLASIGVAHERTFPDSSTGGGDFMNRPAMRELIAYIKSKPHKKFVVVFDDLKRFARDTEFHIKLRATFKALDVELRCLNYKFDESPEGRFAETVMAAQGQLEREQNRRQVIQKQAACLERGHWPFGGKKGYVRRKDGIMEPGEHREVLKKALEDFSSGILVRKIDFTRYLHEQGFWVKQKPEKYLDKASLLLKDPFYAGYVEYPSWEVSRRPGEHEGVISLETFERIQKRLGKEEFGKRIRMDINPDFPLRGLVLCDDCGKRLTGAPSGGRSKKYPYYVCHTTGCSSYGKSIPGKEIEEKFEDLLRENVLRAESDHLVKTVFDAVWDDELKQYKLGQSVIQKEYDALETKAEELTKLILATPSPALKGLYEHQLEKLAKEIETKPELPNQAMDWSVPYRTALDKSTAMLKNPYAVWESVDVIEKHQLFFFLFEGRLPYSKKEGYRTDVVPSAARLFEDFAGQNTQDVEPPTAHSNFSRY